jgi:hypothetical protein
MLIDDDACGSGVDNFDDRLVNALPINCVGATGCTLSFDGEFQDMAGWGEFWVNVFDGVTWTNVYYTTVDTPDFSCGNNFPAAIPIPMADNCPTVFLEFQYSDDDPGWGSGWAWGAMIDNIEIKGYSGVVPPTPSLWCEFDAWWDLELSASSAKPGDHGYLEINNNCVPDVGCEYHCDWQNVDLGLFNWWSGPVDHFEFQSKEHTGADGDGWVNIRVDLGPYIQPSDTFCLRFRFESDIEIAVNDDPYHFRGIKIRNFVIEDLIWVDDIVNPHTEDFEDFMSCCPDVDLSNWVLDNLHFGQYWDYIPEASATVPPIQNKWCTDYDNAYFPALTINDALVWETEIADAYEAYFTFTHEYDFKQYALGDLEYEAFGLVEISADGGDSWMVLGEYHGDSGGPVEETFNLNYYVGNDILIRFRAIGEGDNYWGCTEDGGKWCVYDLLVSGKKDTQAPNTEITMQGQLVDGWYSTPVQVTITATDVGAGMGDIHYILDGKETVVPGTQAKFTVSANGVHNIEFWGVDKTGNEETPHNIVPTFRIDSGSPPSVQITAPEPGLYLFGNKLLSLSKVFIIGAFTIEATASDAESGVYRVAFYLDGDLIAEDTEAPYSAYCAQKHMGAGTLKAVAEDLSFNSAEDTLDVTYYKFL